MKIIIAGKALCDMAFSCLPFLLWIAFSCSLEIPEKYANESYVPILEKYARSIHLIEQSDESLGVELKNGMKMLFSADQMFDDGIDITIDVGLGFEHFDADYREIPHIIEHLVLAERSPSQFDQSLSTFCAMHGIYRGAITDNVETLYQFIINNVDFVEPFLDKLINNMFNLSIKQEMVEREYKIVIEEFFLRNTVYHMWLLNDQGKYIYKPPKERMLMKDDIDLSNLARHVRSAYNNFYKPKFMNLLIRGRNYVWPRYIAYFIEKFGQIENGDNSMRVPLIVQHDDQSPNVFARIVSQETRMLVVSWNIASCVDYDQHSINVLLDYALHGEGSFMDQVREQKLLDWKMELKLDHLSPVTISFSEKIGCQMRVEIRLTEKGVTQHKKVLKLLANSLEVILNYTQQDWEPIYRAFDKWFHKFDNQNANIVHSIKKVGLQKCLAAMKEKHFQSHIDIFLSNLRLLRQKTFYYALIAPLSAGENISSFDVMQSSFRTMESLAKISDSEIMKSGTQNGSLFIKTSNPMEERPSNEDNWKNISLHGDSIPQFAYSRRQFDELEINFETKTATSMESRNWLLGRVYMQLLSEKLNDDADFNGTLMDGGSYGFGIKMPMRSFDKLAEILLLHNLPNKSYIDACTKFVNTSQLATCDNSVLQDVAKYIASFYSQAKPYVKATGRIESKEVVHCHRKILRKLLLGGEQMEIGGISNYIINERGPTNYINITSSTDGLHNGVAIGFFVPFQTLSYQAREMFDQMLNLFAFDNLRGMKGLGYNVHESKISVSGGHYFAITVSGLAHSPSEMENHIMEMLSSLHEQLSANKLLVMEDTIYSNRGFKSLLEKYFDPNSVHTNRIVVHCRGGSQHSKKEFLKSLVEK